MNLLSRNEQAKQIGLWFERAIADEVTKHTGSDMHKMRSEHCDFSTSCEALVEVKSKRHSDRFDPYVEIPTIARAQEQLEWMMRQGCPFMMILGLYRCGVDELYSSPDLSLYDSYVIIFGEAQVLAWAVYTDKQLIKGWQGRSLSNWIKASLEFRGDPWTQVNHLDPAELLRRPIYALPRAERAEHVDSSADDEQSPPATSPNHLDDCFAALKRCLVERSLTDQEIIALIENASADVNERLLDTRDRAARLRADHLRETLELKESIAELRSELAATCRGLLEANRTSERFFIDGHKIASWNRRLLVCAYRALSTEAKRLSDELGHDVEFLSFEELVEQQFAVGLAEPGIEETLRYFERTHKLIDVNLSLEVQSEDQTEH